MDWWMPFPTLLMRGAQELLLMSDRQSGRPVPRLSQSLVNISLIQPAISRLDCLDEVGGGEAE